MALPATAVGEVRATGSDTLCSGFFNSVRGGTDYSQQNAAQATGTVTVSANTCTATTGIFTAAMVGNYITDGTLYREITAFTSSTVVTLDSTVAWTAATIYVGGALASLGKAKPIAISGNIIFQKAGTYSISTATVNVSGGTVSDSAFVTICGYSTNRTLGNTDARPVNQYTVSSVTMCGTNTRSLWINIEFDGNAQTSARHDGGVANQFFNCMIRNMNTASSGTTPLYCGCEATGNGVAILLGQCIACEAHDNTATPYTILGASDCLSYDNTGATTDGFATQGSQATTFANCHSYHNGRDGFAFSATNRSTLAINCHAESNGQYGFNCGADNAVALVNCSYYLNTSGPVNATGQVARIGEISTVAGSVYVNAVAHDFRPNNTALAGALLRAAGFPAMFPRGLTANYLDVGAVQHADPAGGAGGLRRGVFGNING